VRAAFDHIKALEKKGFIRCNKNRSRAIEIIEDLEEDSSEDLLKIPILGSVAAGIPILSEENFDGTIVVPSSQLPGGSNYFALKVQGESMIQDGILNGDLAIIRQQNVAENGDIVVALIDEAVTLKHFFKQPNRIMLRAANPEFKDKYYSDLKILGKLSQIVRRY